MKQYYVVQDGKLASVTPNKKSIFPYIFAIVLAVLFGGGAYYYAAKSLALPSDSVVLSQKDLTHYVEIEKAFARTLEKTVSSQEYVLSNEELKEVFNHVFPEVKLAPEVEQEYLRSVATWAAHYSMPPLLVLSIIWRESFFDESTISSANARGPMQVIYTYHKEKLERINKGEQDLHEIDTGIRIGVEILREYFDRYKRNIFRAMQAYVGGVHKTYAQDILTRYFNARIYVEEQL